MIRRYTKHQIKVFLQSKKLWIVSIMFIIFFPLYYSYFQTVNPDTVYSQKSKEKKLLLMTLDILPHDINDTDKGSEIYDNLTEQLSLINMQMYYVSEGEEIEEYVSDGIRLNKLRLELHDKGNPYVPDYFVIPKKDIKDENKFLQYLEDNDLTIEDNPYYMTHFLASAFDFISGSLLFIMILLFGSNMFAYEHVQVTLLKKLPVSFTQRAISKLSLLFIMILTSMSVGLLLGILRSLSASGVGHLKYPILIYENSEMTVIPIFLYLLYVCLAIVIIVLMILSLALLLEQIFKNTYATILIGLFLYILPDVFHRIGFTFKVLYPLKFVNITSVLSGDLAKDYDLTSIDYWNSLLAMITFTIIVLLISVVYEKISFRK